MEYPEHKKLSKVIAKSQAIGEFLDWLQNERHVQLCEWDVIDESFIPTHKSITNWLSEYFGIDQVKLENEKIQMLEEIRHGQKEAEEN